MKTAIVGGVITFITAIAGAFYTSTQSTAEFGVRIQHIEEGLAPLVDKEHKNGATLAVLANELSRTVAKGNRTSLEVRALQEKIVRLNTNSEQILNGLADLTEAVTGLSNNTAELAIITGRIDERVKNLEKK